MRMHKIFDIERYRPSKGERFMFDTNIWMYIFCPIGNYREHIVQRYSSFLGEAINTKAEIIINSLILSEFINSYLRLEFKIFKIRNPNAEFKKDFRKNSSYKRITQNISSASKNILKISKGVDDKFSSIDIESIISEFEKQNLDFNDLYYQEYCKIGKVKIVTDDKDFKYADTEIITGNPRILEG
ncbi:MAG: hypothetical protein COT16_00340 [Elusimicrobia bacterium CG08_land_8_20_14_0_20_44_26]|nr:MAG: hypothetical protein COT16_00340 [Elusimicrobia bacterium CG08_land_8_20_14_0_20_44_26]